jgi:hypothetical protein
MTSVQSSSMLAYMRESRTAIPEAPISEHTTPRTGRLIGKAVAKDDLHIAFATAANSFFLVACSSLTRDVQIGERLALRFHQGHASIDNGRDRGR